MERLKKQKIQEILDAQNATIDASMVCVTGLLLFFIFYKVIVNLMF